MMRQVAVVDYGMGNLFSVTQALRHVARNHAVVVAEHAEQIEAAERIVLPGQGAISACMQHLTQSPMWRAVVEALKNKPVFGVCVGMQMLLDQSDEGHCQALGLIQGQVKHFKSVITSVDLSHLKIPHMGWNRVSTRSHPIFKGIGNNTWFYFVHSFCAFPQNDNHTLGSSVYGAEFSSIIGRDNLFATQFHPEKSATAGLALFQNFLSWNP